MFKRTFAIVLTAGAVFLFGGVVIAGAQSVSNRPAPAFVPASVTDSSPVTPATTGSTVAATPPSVPTSRPPATTATSVATSVPTSQPRATTATSLPTSQPRSTVTSLPGSTTVVTIDDHGGDRPRDDRSGSGSGRSGGSDD
jgi:hypothetical protein